MPILSLHIHGTIQVPHLLHLYLCLPLPNHYFHTHNRPPQRIPFLSLNPIRPKPDPLNPIPGTRLHNLPLARPQQHTRMSVPVHNTL